MLDTTEPAFRRTGRLGSWRVASETIASCSKNPHWGNPFVDQGAQSSQWDQGKIGFRARVMGGVSLFGFQGNQPGEVFLEGLAQHGGNPVWIARNNCLEGPWRDPGFEETPKCWPFGWLEKGNQQETSHCHDMGTLDVPKNSLIVIERCPRKEGLDIRGQQSTTGPSCGVSK